MRSVHILVLLLSAWMQACAGGAGGGSGGSLSGNEGGSEPINSTEERDYKRAVLKCYKTGGSRVVKIEGRLMCY